MMPSALVALIIPLGLVSVPVASASDCAPKLWPAALDWPQSRKSISQELLTELTKRADKALTAQAAPVAELHSAGVTDLQDPGLIASRRGFQDADRAQLLALASRVLGKPAYGQAADQLVLAWAKTNHPTGQPIDETRLDGLIWAFDLRRCDYTARDIAVIEGWLKALRERKQSFQWGPKSINNNHKTHQLKSMLLLDKALGDEAALVKDTLMTEQHAKVNLPNPDGQSLDFQERGALYYHVYDLDAWTEILLETACCAQPVEKAFEFMRKRIESGEIGGEFTHSTAPIDAKRGNAGFAYAKTGGDYDLTHAAHAVATYYTARPSPPSPQLEAIVRNAKPDDRLTFYRIRKALWNPH